MLLPSVNILQDLTGKGRESECKRKATLYLLALRRSLGVWRPKHPGITAQIESGDHKNVL